MLISFDEISNYFKKIGLEITGAFHIGAHDCEELDFYHKLGLLSTDVVWIDAIDEKIEQAKTRGIPNVYGAVVTDKDDADVVFNISNNGQSSSVLEFGTHSQQYPHIFYVQKVNKKSITIDTFFERNGIDPKKYNFWNFDIQGAELMALKGAEKAIEYAKVIYMEVNVDELYVGCGRIGDIDQFLGERGFTRVCVKMVRQGWGDAIYVRL